MTGLNPSLIQHTVWARAAEGVTKAEKNLFNGAPDAPIYVIPTGDALTVTIVYDIETRDQRLAGTVSDLETAGVSVENKITKNITVSSNALKLEAGKKYTINLHLGMSQVEFDADVVAWDDTTPAGEAWLPGNGEAAPAPARRMLANATSADIDKWVDADGNILDSPTGAAGWIGHATDDHHGLIVAMVDSATDKTWDEAQTTDFSGLPAISGTTGTWFLPGLYLQGIGGSDELGFVMRGIRSKPNHPFVVRQRYWSSTSTPNNNTEAYYGVITVLGAASNLTSKSDLCNVRAVIAF